MSLPEGLFDLGPADGFDTDGRTEGDRLKKAAGLVENFVAESGIDALDGLLEAADKGGIAGCKKALSAAKRSLDQTSMLEREVHHFLAQSKSLESAE